MFSPSSNRNNPKFVEYYQTLADVIGIFWEFHKRRIQSGNIEFALTEHPETRKLVPFNPLLKTDLWQKGGNLHPHKVLEDFSDAVLETHQGSWQQFLEGLGRDSIKGSLAEVEVPEGAKKFFDPYIEGLIVRVEQLGTELSRVHFKEGFSISSLGNAGFNTGTMVTTQLIGLFGDEFRPLTAVLISKVRLEDVGLARKEVGLPAISLKGEFEIPLGDYSLLDNSPLGLNRDRLRELGLGDTLGCPAGMKISHETQEFLVSKGVSLSGKTMLEEFAGMMSEQFDRYLGFWYRGLTTLQRQTLIDPETERVLAGEVRRLALQENDLPRCPYSKERI